MTGRLQRGSSGSRSWPTRAATLTWFVDGALIGSAAAEERVYWTPAAGKHKIVVADDAGQRRAGP